MGLGNLGPDEAQESPERNSEPPEPGDRLPAEAVGQLLLEGARGLGAPARSGRSEPGSAARVLDQGGAP